MKSRVSPSNRSPRPALARGGAPSERRLRTRQWSLGEGVGFDAVRSAGLTPPPNRKQGGRDPRTGLPRDVKHAAEQRSGFAMDDVRVTYNAMLPGTVGARAVTKGSRIAIAPGAESSVSHELWHVAQQKRRGVLANAERDGRAINDDPALEREADAFRDAVVSDPDRSKRTPDAVNLRSTSTTGLAPLQLDGSDDEADDEADDTDSADAAAKPKGKVRKRQRTRDRTPTRTAVAQTSLEELRAAMAAAAAASAGGSGGPGGGFVAVPQTKQKARRADKPSSRATGTAAIADAPTPNTFGGFVSGSGSATGGGGPVAAVATPLAAQPDQPRAAPAKRKRARKPKPAAQLDTSVATTPAAVTPSAATATSSSSSAAAAPPTTGAQRLVNLLAVHGVSQQGEVSISQGKRFMGPESMAGHRWEQMARHYTNLTLNSTSVEQATKLKLFKARKVAAKTAKAKADADAAAAAAAAASAATPTAAARPPTVASAAAPKAKPKGTGRKAPAEKAPQKPVEHQLASVGSHALINTNNRESSLTLIRQIQAAGSLHALALGTNARKPAMDQDTQRPLRYQGKLRKTAAGARHWLRSGAAGESDVDVAKAKALLKAAQSPGVGVLDPDKPDDVAAELALWRSDPKAPRVNVVLHGANAGPDTHAEVIQSAFRQAYLQEFEDENSTMPAGPKTPCLGCASKHRVRYPQFGLDVSRTGAYFKDKSGVKPGAEETEAIRIASTQPASGSVSQNNYLRNSDNRDSDTDEEGRLVRPIPLGFSVPHSARNPTQRPWMLADGSTVLARASDDRESLLNRLKKDAAKKAKPKGAATPARRSAAAAISSAASLTPSATVPSPAAALGSGSGSGSGSLGSASGLGTPSAVGATSSGGTSSAARHRSPARKKPIPVPTPMPTAAMLAANAMTAASMALGQKPPPPQYQPLPSLPPYLAFLNAVPLASAATGGAAPTMPPTAARTHSPKRPAQPVPPGHTSAGALAAASRSLSLMSHQSTLRRHSPNPRPRPTGGGSSSSATDAATAASTLTPPSAFVAKPPTTSPPNSTAAASPSVGAAAAKKPPMVRTIDGRPGGRIAFSSRSKAPAPNEWSLD